MPAFHTADQTIVARCREALHARHEVTIGFATPGGNAAVTGIVQAIVKTPIADSPQWDITIVSRAELAQGSLPALRL